MYDELIKRLRRCASYDPRFVIQDCEDAADAIEDLGKSLAIALLEYQIANNKRIMTEEYAKQKQRWIPVTERLPEESRSYLVVDSGHVTEAYYGKEWAGDNWTDPVEMYMSFHPTHWMPLPEPPESEGK